MMKPLNPVFAKLLGRATRLVHKGPLADIAAHLQQALRNTMSRSSSTPSAGADVLDGLVREVGPRPAPAAAPTAAPDAAGGRFSSHTFADGRHYKLFVPGGFEGRRLPLVLMLHGCTQDPDDFAAGTRMNEIGQAQGVIVLYPAQPQRSNASKCWNWFQPGDQHRERGEPAVLAGITREVLARHPVDEDRVYVAGLSAGGAMAAILGSEYPELFAATGVHSGLPQGAAHDIPSAFAAMQGRPAMPSPMGTAWSAPAATAPSGKGTPTIVFHGDADGTVHPGNGEKVVSAALASTGGGGATTEVVRGQAAGRDFTRSVYIGADGKPRAEHWVVHGAGHAWSGGSTQGSYADAQGPDASKEMLRFFLSHRRR
jgi:poly(hydroxyalkanoate) depolymerase family esterase